MKIAFVFVERQPAEDRHLREGLPLRRHLLAAAWELATPQSLEEAPPRPTASGRPREED
jgi:hypothetical protein